jgi:hypothetical protein
MADFDEFCDLDTIAFAGFSELRYPIIPTQFITMLRLLCMCLKIGLECHKFVIQRLEFSF